MPKNRFGILTLLAVTAFVGFSIAAFQYYQYRRRIIEINSCVEQFAGSDFRKKFELYQRIFEAAREDILPSLVINENDSLATQSAWETVLLTIPIDVGESPYKPDPKTTHRFLKVVSGRFDTEIPSWWQDVVVNCSAISRFSIQTGDPQEEPYRVVSAHDVWLPEPYSHNRPLVECPLTHSIEETENGFLYKSPSKTIDLSKNIFGSDRYYSQKSFGNILGHVSGAFSDSSFFCVLHPDGGHAYELICVDIATNNIKWKSTACGSSTYPAVSTFGPSNTWATIVIGKKNQLIVFGACPSGFFVHSFDQSTGQTIAECSSGYGLNPSIIQYQKFYPTR